MMLDISYESKITNKFSDLFGDFNNRASDVIDTNLNFVIRDSVHYKVSVILYGKVIEPIRANVLREEK